MMMRSSNPTLNENTFNNFDRAISIDNCMTVQGTVNKTGVLLLLVFISFSWTWRLFLTGSSSLPIWMFGGLVGGLIVSLVTMYKKEWASVTAPLYALLEGLALGGISAFLEASYKGIVFQAVGLTFGTLFGLLFAYKTGIIKVTDKFRNGVIAATGGIAIVYLINMILGFFGMRVPFMHETGIIGIGFSLFVVVIAAMNLVLNFDFIEKGALVRAPKYMEWYSAFGLIVTLVWLYIEILNLLLKLRNRD